MRRKKDDKRVLISPRDKNQKPSRRQKRMKSSNMPRKKHKRSSLTVLLMILALLAFVIGAAIGISLSFDDDGSDDGPHWVNVTKEMTTNLNDTEHFYYDREVDNVDYNDNKSLEELNITVNDTPSY